MLALFVSLIKIYTYKIMYCLHICKH